MPGPAAAWSLRIIAASEANPTSTATGITNPFTVADGYTTVVTDRSTSIDRLDGTKNDRRTNHAVPRAKRSPWQ